MRNKRKYIYLFVIFTFFLAYKEPCKAFSLEKNVISDLELFMYNYEFDEGEGLLFEILDEANKIDVQKIEKNTEDKDVLKQLALSYIGKKYKYGANGPEEFDCSGFVLHYYNTLGKTIPRTSILQSEFGILINKEDLQIGDVVFFDTRNSNNSKDIKINEKDILLEAISDVEKDKKVTHCGIYIGDGKFVHASSGSIMRVVIEDLNSKYFSQRYLFARRYL